MTNICELSRASRGQSEAAKELELLEQREEKDLLLSISMRARLEQALRQLQEVACEAGHSGWDGYGARPTDWHSYERATMFLRALPTTFPLPDLSVDGEGDITMDWRFGWRQALTVALKGDGQIAFAWIKGYSSGRGTGWFGDGIPSSVVNAIAMFTGQEPLGQL